MAPNDAEAGRGQRLERREFLTWTGKRAVGLGAIGLSLPALLQACSRSGTPAARPEKPAGFSLDDYKKRAAEAQDQANPLIGDILDFKLVSDDWEGPFGFVKFRLHRGLVDGKQVFFIRTDASDEAFAMGEKLVFVPRLAPLATEALSGAAYVFTEGAADQSAVLSTEPGRDDYTPAWQIHRVSFKRGPRKLSSVAEIQQAERGGDIEVEKTKIVMNAPMVKWSSGELPVDRELKTYFPAQLIEAPETSGMTVTFKLNECFPRTRYIVTDHSIKPAADMTKTSFAPKLQGGPTKADATGRTNVFMNGIKGIGPMGFQPSAFDFAAGEAQWSPYWDHWAYAWKKGKTPRVLTSQTAIHKARDDGELDEFPGVPDTKGEVFTVNCPGVVIAPNVFTA